MKVVVISGSMGAGKTTVAAIWANFAAAGVNRLLLAEAVEHRGELERIRMAVPGAEITVCRLIPRTDRAVEFTGLVVYRIRDGKIAESRGEIDFLRLIRELRRP